MTPWFKNRMLDCLGSFLCLVSVSVGCSSPSLYIHVAPHDVTPGDRVRISVALKDTERLHGHLRFEWTAAEGTLDQTVASDSPLQFWTAPGHPGFQTLTLIVREDGRQIVERQIPIEVKPLPTTVAQVEYAAPLSITLPPRDKEHQADYNEHWQDDSHGQHSSERISCDPGISGCRFSWTTPPGNRGDLPGLNLTGASSVTFWMRGQRGGEVVVPSVGVDWGPSVQHPSSLPLTYLTDAQTGSREIILDRDWRRYTISLENRDLTNVPVLFEISVPPSKNDTVPVVVYVTDIFYIH